MRSILLLMFVALFIPVSPAPSAWAKTVTEQEFASQALNDFNQALYQRIIEEEGGNVFYSPFSIHLALDMTSFGAAGDTEAQMNQVLGVAYLGEYTPEYAKLLVADLAAALQQDAQDQGYEFSVANRLYGQVGYQFLSGFITDVKQMFGALLEEVDFAGETEGARQLINAWVEEQTKERIKELLPQGILTPLTRLVLVNAVYFKSTWDSPFDPEMTMDEAFHLEGGTETVDVPMMHQLATASYAESDWGQSLFLPYAGERLGMLVMLPGKGGMAGLETALSKGGVETIMASMSMEQVDVSLPKWKSTQLLDLKETLMDLGMDLAFTSGAADFSSMNGSRDLYITDVVHKAFIEVNEEGSEAAAATAVVVGLRSAAPVAPVVFRADRPFVYAIVDRALDSVLFMGRLMDPADPGE